MYGHQQRLFPTARAMRSLSTIFICVIIMMSNPAVNLADTHSPEQVALPNKTGTQGGFSLDPISHQPGSNSWGLLPAPNQPVSLPQTDNPSLYGLNSRRYTAKDEDEDEDDSCESPGDQPDPCQYVKDNCQDFSSTINYLQLYYCQLEPNLPLPVLLLIFGIYLAILFYLLGTTGDRYFCRSLVSISRAFRLPHDVTAITFYALGSGSTDLFSVLASLSADDIELALGGLLGAANFAVCLVFGVVLTISGPLQVHPFLFPRDVTFYWIAILAIFIVCLDGSIHIYEPLGLMGFYSLYVFFAFWRVRYRNQLLKKTAFPEVHPSCVFPQLDEAEPIYKPLPMNDEGDGDENGGDGDNGCGTVAERGSRGGDSANEPIKQCTFLGEEKKSGDIQPSRVERHDPQTYYPDVNADVRQHHDRYVSENQEENAGEESFLSSVVRFLSNPVASITNRMNYQIVDIQHGEDEEVDDEDDDEEEETADMEQGGSLQKAIKGKKGEINPTINHEIGCNVSEHGENEASNAHNGAHSHSENGSHGDGDDNGDDDDGDDDHWTIHDWPKVKWYLKPVFVVTVFLDFIRDASVPPCEKADWSHWRATVSPLFASLLLAYTAFRANTFNAYIGHTHFLVVYLCIIVSAPICVGIYYTTNPNGPPKNKMYRGSFVLASFAMSVVWTYHSATTVVSVLQALGLAVGVSSSILGITVLAWGNTIGDLVAGIALAKQNKPQIVVTACYAAPFFNITIGFGINLIIATLDGALDFKMPTNNLLAFCTLLVILPLTTITLYFYKWVAPRWAGFFLIAYYGLFVVMSGFIESGLVG